MKLSTLFQRAAQSPDDAIADGNRTILHLAALEGDIDIARQSLDAGARVDTVDDNGDTPLIAAVKAGDAAMVTLLARHETAAPDHAGNTGTALMLAAAEGRIDIAVALLGAGAKIDAADSDGTTALMSAIFARQPAMRHFLLETGANAGAKRSNGETALHLAAREDDTDAIRDIVAHGYGALLQERTSVNKLTPLSLAVMTEQYNAAACLLELGAMTNIPDSQDRLPLEIATERGDTRMARLLVTEGHADIDGFTNPAEHRALHRAIYAEKPQMARTLVDLGADPLLYGPNCHMPVTLAAWKGDFELVRYFLEELPQPAEDSPAFKKALSNAIYEAMAYDHEDIALYLIASGRADLDMPAYTGVPLLMGAVTFGDATVLQALLDAGANPNLKDNKGSYPLYTAVARNEMTLSEKLLAAKANPDFGNGCEAPLHACAAQGYDEMAQRLLAAGAKADVRDEYKRLPLDVARMKNQPALCALLTAAMDSKEPANQQTTPPSIAPPGPAARKNGPAAP